MTDAGQAARDRATALAQVPVAVLAAALTGVDLRAGLLALAVLVALWPPRVGFRPLAPGGVLVRYVPFALLWYAVVYGYLRVMHALGHTIAPQAALRQLAEFAQTSAIAGYEGQELLFVSAAVFGIVVLAPFFEEVLFRGYLFTALERSGVPMVVTQLLTATVFGLVHTLDYALPIGLLALLFGWLRMRYRSLLPCILAHAVHNGLTVLVTLLWPGHLAWLYPQ